MSNRRLGKFKTPREMLKRCLKDPGRSQRISKWYLKKSCTLEKTAFLGVCEVWVVVTSAQRLRDCFSSRMQNAKILGRRVTDHIADYRSLFVAIGISAKLQFRYGGASRTKVLAFTRYTTIFRIARLFCYRTNAHTRALSSIQIVYFPPRRARIHVCVHRPYRARAPISRLRDFLVFAISQK